MSFITDKEFLKQSEKVQNELLKWWQPQIGDLYSSSNNGVLKVIDIDVFSEYQNEGNLNTTIHCFNPIEDMIIPLLQQHQLIDFIESKRFRIISIDRGRMTDNWHVRVSNMDEFEIINSDGYDTILEALWKVAIKITNK